MSIVRFELNVALAPGCLQVRNLRFVAVRNAVSWHSGDDERAFGQRSASEAHRSRSVGMVLGRYVETVIEFAQEWHPFLGKAQFELV